MKLWIKRIAYGFYLAIVAGVSGFFYPLLLALVGVGAFLDSFRMIYWRRAGWAFLTDVARHLVIVPVFWLGLYAPGRAMVMAVWRTSSYAPDAPRTSMEIAAAVFGILLGAGGFVAAAMGRWAHGERGEGGEPRAPRGSDILWLVIADVRALIPESMSRHLGTVGRVRAFAMLWTLCGVGMLAWEIARLEPTRWTIREVRQYAPLHVKRARFLERLNGADPAAVRESVGDLSGIMGEDPSLVPVIARKVVELFCAGDGESQGFALRWLQRVGYDAPALSPLLPGTDQESYENRSRDAAALLVRETLGIEAKAMAPKLLEASRSRDSEVRAFGVFGLGAIGADTAIALPVLREATRDPESKVRMQAVKGLREMGPAAREAEPELRRARQDEDWGVRGHAHIALARLSPESESALEALRFFVREAGWQPEYLRTDAARLAGAAGMPFLREALKDGDKNIRARAIEALGAIGPPAAAALPDLLPPPWKPYEEWEIQQSRAAAAAAALKIGLPAAFDLIHTGDADTRRRAADLMVPFLPEPGPGQDQALAALRHESAAVRCEIADLFGRVMHRGDISGMPLITRDLAEAARRETDPRVRLRMELAAWKYDHWDAPGTMPVLQAALKDENEGVRVRAIDALRKAGPEAVAALPALVAALKDARVQFTAVEILKSLKADARAAAPALREVIRDAGQNETLRWNALECLRDTAGMDEYRSALVELLVDTTLGRQAASHLLQHLPADQVGPWVVTQLREGRHRALVLAWLADAAWGRELREGLTPIVPEFIRILEGPPEERLNAARILGKFGPIGTDVAPVLRSALSDPAPTVRAAAAEALKFVGSAGLPAIPALLKALGEPDVAVRRAAVGAIVQIWQAARTAEPDAEAAVPVLVRALGDGDAHVRGGAASALYYVGPKAGAAVPALKAMLREDNYVLRGNAALSLGSMAGAASSAVPDLIRLLEDPESYVRGHAATALGRLGTVAKEAVPAIEEALAAEPPRGPNRYYLGKALKDIRKEMEPKP